MSQPTTHTGRGLSRFARPRATALDLYSPPCRCGIMEALREEMGTLRRCFERKKRKLSSSAGLVLSHVVDQLACKSFINLDQAEAVIMKIIF